MLPISPLRMRNPSVVVPATDPLWTNVILLVYGEGADAGVAFTDHSTVGRALTANGNVQHDTGQDVHGQSIMFDGTTDYISMPDAVDLRLNGSTGSHANDFCLECYAYITTNAHVNQLFNKQFTGTLNDYKFYVDTAGKLNFALAGAGSTVGATISAGAVPLNQAVHLAVTRNLTALRLFIDGTLDGTTTQSGAVGDTAHNLNLGHSNRTAGEDFQGWANWFRFTKGASRYTANFTPPSTPLPTS